MIASSGFLAVTGMVMLSVQSVPPSSGMTNWKFVPSETFFWKMSPDHAWVIHTSPLPSASM